MGCMFATLLKKSKHYPSICQTAISLSPIPPHPARQLITALLRLNEDDGFVLLLCHYFLHQLNQSVWKNTSQLSCQPRQNRQCEAGTAQQ